MKQQYRKKLAAVGLSVCLAASQGIIPLSAYGQESGPDQKDIHMTQTETAESVNANQEKNSSDSISNQQAKEPSDSGLYQRVNEKLTQNEEQTSSVYQADFNLNGKQDSPAGKSDSNLSGNQDASISKTDSGLNGNQDASPVKTDSNTNGKQDSPAVQPSSDSNGNAQKEESSAIQITGWKWIDPDRHLVNGALIIPNTEKIKPLDFDQIAAMLPQAISVTAAEIDTGKHENADENHKAKDNGGKADPSVNSGKAGASTEKNKRNEASNGGSVRELTLPLDGWSCDAFQQTPSGSWPETGVYTFNTHPVYGGGIPFRKV